jgi:hypothetical protein
VPSDLIKFESSREKLFTKINILSTIFNQVMFTFLIKIRQACGEARWLILGAVSFSLLMTLVE